MISYQWYESSDGSLASSVAIDGATEEKFVTPVYTEKGIHYYYCVVKNLATNETEISQVHSMAYTGLPTVYVETPSRVAITSKEI